MNSVSKNELVKQISLCGQMIERKVVHFQEKNVDEEILLACFTQGEKDTLKELLSKMQNYWIEAHKKAHQKN